MPAMHRIRRAIVMPFVENLFRARPVFRLPLGRPLALSLLAVAVCAGWPARAADTAKDKPKSQAVTLEAVKVTAEKSGRSLKDTAASVTVLDGETLDRRGIDDSRAAMGQIPNVTNSGPGNLAPAVRGVDGTGSAQGADAFFAGSRARLGVQVDGRPASYNEVVFGNASLWDVEQVEMLNGPQSTLQGRNAIAGTLVIKTRDPTWSPEGAVRLLAGNQGRGQAAFYLSGPVSDEVALRISGDYQARHSVVKFQPYQGVGDPGQYAMRTLRAKLLYEPAALPGFHELVTVQHADSRGPQVANEARPFGQHQALSPEMPVFAPSSDSVISDTNWAFADRLSFENLLTATDLTVRRRAPPGSGIARIDTDEYMLEPRLRLDQGDGVLSGVVGVHMFRTYQREFIDFPVDERFHDRVNTNALFGEGVLALGDRFDLTFGARYEQEHHRRYGGDGAVVAISLDETDREFLPKLGLAWHPGDQWTLGVYTSRGYNGGGGGITYETPIVNYSYKPEHVRDYEAYFRGDLAGGRVEWTGNVFYGDYRDMQLPFDLNPDPAVWSVVVRNAPKAKNYGVETSLRWHASDTLDLYGNLGLLRTRVTSYPDSGIEGNAFARSPNATGGLGVDWHGWRGFEASLNARYSDGYWSDIEHMPRGHTKPYWLANARVGHRAHGLYTFVYVDNLFDEDTPLAIGPGATPAQDGAVLPQPRSYGIGMQWDFLP
jgi:outer membrane receptor protein involved in Fe transport